MFYIKDTIQGEPLSPIFDSVSLLLYNSLFSPQSSILLDPPILFPYSLSLPFSFPWKTPPPSVVTKLKEATESKVYGVPPRLSSADWRSATLQAGKQAGRQAATLDWCVISYLSYSRRNVDLIKDSACHLNSDRLVNRKRREGEKIVRRRNGGKHVQCCKEVRGEAAEKCGLG